MSSEASNPQEKIRSALGGRVRAKFRCDGVEKILSWRARNSESGERFLYTAKFQPVGDNSEENKKFWSATPSGQITLTSILPDAFEVGQEYYIDFIPVPAA